MIISGYEKCKKNGFFAFLLFILALAYYYLTFISSDLISAPNTYQARDILRGYAVALGDFSIWHGPEMSASGYLPGPFYYYLLGAVYFFTQSVLSLYWLMFALASVTAAGMWLYLRIRYSFLSATIFFLTFLSSPFFQIQLVDFMNPSFQFLFFALTLILFWEAGDRKLWLWLAGLMAGISAQFHFSVAVLVIAYLITQTFNFKLPLSKKLIRMFLTVLGMATSCAPFLHYSLVHSNDLSTNNDFSIHLTRKIFFLNRTISELKLITFDSLFDLLKAEYYLLPSLFLTAWGIKKKVPSLSFAAVALVLGLFPMLRPNLGLDVSRYFTPLLFLALFVFAIQTTRARSTVVRYTALLLFSGFIIFNFLNSQHVHENKKNYSFYTTTLKNQIDFLNVLQAESGWNYEYFRSHSFITDIGQSTNFEVTYKLILKEPLSNNRNYHGLLAIHKKHGIIFDDEWFLLNSTHKVVPTDILNAFSNKSVSCKQVLQSLDYNLCFYNFLNDSNLLRWSNIGTPYSSTNRVVTTSDSNHLVVVDNNTAIFKFNRCRNRTSECDVFFKVSFRPGSNIFLSVIGLPLSVNNLYDSPLWTWSVESPELKISCTRSERSYTFALGIGYSPDKPFFKTPYDAIIDTDCKNPDSISLVLNYNINYIAANHYGPDISKEPITIVWNRNVN